MNVLDKEEFRIKLEEINKLVQLKDYKGAMEIVDSIDWRRVKNVRTLCVVGEIYAANKRYEDSKEIFLLAYNRASIGKNILYRLVEISLKMNDIDDAVEFFDEYKQIVPNDNTRYILEYKIAKAKNNSLNEQIKILEEYKDREFTEKWSYELASLYYKAGDKEKCLDLCNEIILWFSEGKYVTKALDLKMRMGELTGAEREKFEQQFIPKLITPEEKKNMDEENADSNQEQASKFADKAEENPIESIPMDERDINSAESLQEKISKGIRDIFNGKKKEVSEETDGVKEEDQEPIPEEIIKTNASVSEPENVPALEPETYGEKPDFSKTIKMPELKIPDSMKNIDIPQAPVISAPDITQEEIAEEKKNLDFDFNLEETILAAASAQGIKIPEEPAADETAENIADETLDEAAETPGTLEKNEETVFGEPKEDVKLNEASVEKKAYEKKTEIPRLEEEEFLTEEDLQSAEDEFLNGPAARKADFNLEDNEEDDFLEKLLNEQADAFTKEEADLKKMKQDEEVLTEEEELERLIDSFNTSEETDPLDIIPRERKLLDDEKKIFTYFVKVPGVQEQLIDTLCDVQLAAADETSRTGNIIVMGGKECGKTRLISSLIPAICKELNIEASKVAYVFADQINDKDINAIVKKLAGGFFVIENANQLNQRTVDMLDKVMEKNTEGMIVIIEDEKIDMRKLMARFPKFAKKFTSMINIPVFTNDELVNFARVYTKENGFVIDQMGMLALYNLISVNQKEDEPMSIGAVKDIIDTAIMKSQGGIRKLKRNISKKRTDNDGFIVLYEKDFTK